MPGQAAQRQQPRHEAQIGVRFTGPDKLVHLIGLSEVMPSLGRGLEVFLHRPIQAAEDFTDGNQPVSLTRHGLSFSHAPQTKAGPHSAPQREKGDKG